jgi:hypothetical protein
MRQFAFILALVVILEFPESCRAAEDLTGYTIYRSGDFKRTDAEITDCTGHKLLRRHPELDYYSASTDHGILSGPMNHDGFVCKIDRLSIVSRRSIQQSHKTRGARGGVAGNRGMCESVSAR